MIKIFNQKRTVNLQNLFPHTVLVDDTVEITEIITTFDDIHDSIKLTILLIPENHDLLMEFVNLLPTELQGTSSQIIKSMKKCLDT